MDSANRSDQVPGISGVALGWNAPPARMTVVTITDPGPAGRDRYRVTVVFRHPTQAAGFARGAMGARSVEGDSGLRIPENARILFEEPEVEGGELRISLEANANGNLGRAVAEFVADDPNLARRIMTMHLGAVLSRLAMETDAPVAFHWMETRALSTGHAEVAFLYRGDDISLGAWPAWEHHERAFFRNAFAVYREGLTATDAFWAVLCFIRVMEGARAYSIRAGAVMRERGMDLTRPKLTLAADPMIVGPFAAWVGRSMNNVADSLKKEYRVPVAHGVLPDKPMQAADQLGIQNRYWLVRPVAQQVARSLVRRALIDRESLGSDSVAGLDDITFD